MTAQPEVVFAKARLGPALGYDGLSNFGEAGT